MDQVYVFHNIDILGTIAQGISYIFGWIVGGSFLRIAGEVLKGLIFWYLQKAIRDEAPIWYLHVEHFIEGHEGLKRSTCQDGRCSKIN